LAAVDKSHGLPSNYVPNLKNISISGGGQITNDANNALLNLYNDAKTENINITVISGYRSYQTQITTYNYWVSQQKNKGLNQADAEAAANRISAHAGHSEHQLGTTVDLKFEGTGSFDNSDKNLKLYKYLEENAYKFGFVISYPKDKENLTGYSYEPWHIRFIGIDLATDFFNRGYLSNPGDYSTKYLQQLSGT
jgi:D-alanyl-D-alanine carboxypeptidase